MVFIKTITTPLLYSHITKLYMYENGMRRTFLIELKLLCCFKNFMKYQKQVLNRIVHNLTGSKPIKIKKKTKRIFLLYKKWKNFKWLYKMNKIRSYKQKKLNLVKNQFNMMSNLTKNFKIKKQKNMRLSWNKIIQYKNIKHVPLFKFKSLFFKWKYTDKNKIKFIENVHKMNRTGLKKGLLTSVLIAQFFKNLTRKLLIKKIKKTFSIKFRSFVKPKNLNLYHLNNLNTQNVNKTKIVYNINPDKLASKYRMVLSAIIKNNVNYRAIDKYSYDKTSACSKLRNHKKNVITKLFEQNNKATTNLNTVQNNYLTNTTLLNTKLFKITRNNLFTHMLIQNINHMDPYNTTKWNYITSKVKTTDYSNINLTNYSPITCYNYLNVSNNNSNSHIFNNNLFKKFDKSTYKYFFIYYIINFLERYTNKKLWVRVDSQDVFSKFWKNYINKFNQNYSYIYRRFSKLISSQELLEIFIMTSIKFDLQILLLYIKKKIEASHFKKHKKILSIIFDIIKKNKVVLVVTGIKGFSFDIRGKVGVAGNAKKRHVFFSLGKISTTSQNLKSQWQQISVWTPTGQMGVTCLIQM